MELPSGSHVASQATKNAFLSRKPEIPTHVKISERLFFVSWEEEAKWNETFCSEQVRLLTSESLL